jgi:exonuclease SbcD
VKIAHISDTHIGYSAYRSVAANGENQRSVDFARAFAQNVDKIREWDPPLVVHSGDVADRVAIPVRAMLFLRQQLRKLAEIRPDGTRRQVVVIGGNHELSSRRNEACFLELFSDIPGVHVVCDSYKVLIGREMDQASPELQDLAIHCVPHDTWKDLAHEERMGDVMPIADMMNVLVAHGVAGGSTLYRRVLGREYHIPTEVLARDWEYGALGHWHKRGPIGIGAASARVWYAGSTENSGFGDVLENGDNRGHLRVEINQGMVPKVEMVNVPIRAMFRLPVLDASGLGPEEIAAGLLERIKTARDEGRLAGAVIGQIVTGAPREVWALVDVTPARTIAEAALHYEVTAKPVHLTKNDDGEEPKRSGALHGVEEMMSSIANEMIKDPTQRTSAVTMARGLLQAHMAKVVETNIETENETEEVAS